MRFAKRWEAQFVLGTGVAGLLSIAGCPQAGEAGDDTTGAAAAGASSGNQPQSGAQSGSGASAGAASPAAPLLFVSDTANGVLTFSSPATTDGDAAPLNHISGTYGYAAWLVSAVALGVDRTGALVALTSNDGISVFKRAETASGNLTPDRDIYGDATGLTLDSAANDDMVVDVANDRVLACNFAGVFIFDRFSNDGRQGNVAPTRKFSSADLTDPHSLALGSNGDLYVTDLDRIVVFASGGTRSGAIRADRIIKIPAPDAAVEGALSIPDSVFVDAGDRLYVTDTNRGFIFVLEGAAALNGTVAPSRVIDFDFDPDGAFSKNFRPTDIVVDRQGIGYVIDAFSSVIRVIDNIATRSGTLTPDRTIQGPASQLDQPNSLFIWE